MADLSTLSDEELDNLIAQKSKPTKDLSSLSDEELDQMIISKKPEYKNLFEKGLEAVGEFAAPVLKPIAEATEEYIQAPIRKGLETGSVTEAIKQIGSEEKVTPMKELLQKLYQKTGRADKPFSEQYPSFYSSDPEEYKKPFVWQKEGPLDLSEKKLLETGFNIATDPLSYVGFGGAKKVLSPGAKAVTTGLEAVETGAKNVAKRGLVGAGVDVAESAVGKIGDVVQKGANAIAKKAEGTVTSDYLKGISNAIENIKSKSKPTLNPKLDKIANTLKKEGLDINELPMTAKYSPESELSSIYKTQAQLPGGQQIREAHNQFLDKVAQKVIDKTDSYSGGKITGYVDAGEAGNILKQDFDNTIKNVLNKVDFDRKQVWQQNPGLKFDPKSQQKLIEMLADKKGELVKIIENAPDDTIAQQANRALKGVDNIQKSAMVGDLETFQKQLQAWGDFSFGDKVQGIHPSVKRMRQNIYKDSANFYDDYTKKTLGGEVAKSVENSNKLFRDYYSSMEKFEDIFGKDVLAPEKIFSKVIERGDTKLLGDLISFYEKYNPEALSTLKGAYSKNLLGPIRNEMSFAKTLKSLQDPKIRARNKLILGNDLEDLEDLVNVGYETGDYLINPSGTEVMKGYKDFPKAVKQSAELEALKKTLEKRTQQKAAPKIEVQNKVVGQGPQMPATNVIEQPRQSLVRSTSEKTSDAYDKLTPAGNVSKVMVSEQERKKSLKDLYDKYETKKHLKKFMTDQEAKEDFRNSP